MSDDSLTDDSEELIQIKHEVKPSFQSTFTPSSDSWVDKYSPKSVNDICIHPRKLADVRKVLLTMIEENGTNRCPRLLVLYGPSGSSKSTTVKLLVNELINHQSNSLSYIEYHDPTQFPEFLNDAKYKTGVNLSAVIVEEYPNVFHEETHRRFQDAIYEWIHTEDQSLPPLVICVTEVEMKDDEHGLEFFNIHNNLVVDTLLGKRISNNENVTTIKFNPIAMTYIKKTLTLIIRHELKVFNKIPKLEVGQFIGNISKCGDIRSAISNLEFWATYRAKHGMEANELILQLSSGKEVQINLFHAIGKIVYGSESNVDDEEFSADYKTVEDVLHNYGSNSLFQLSLLENYGVFNGGNFGIDHASKIIDNLSIGDVLFRGGVIEGRDIGIRGTRTNLRNLGQHHHQPQGKRGRGGGGGGGLSVKFPSHFRIIREYNRINSEVREYQRYVKLSVSFHDLNQIHGFYEPRIYNSTRYKMIHNPNKRLNYGRLGGSFKQILPSEELPILDNEEMSRVHDQYREDIQQMQMKEDSDDEGELSDPIEDSEIDSDDDEGVFDDSIANEDLDKILSQKSQFDVVNSDDDFLSDDELEDLIKRRKL